MALLHNKLNDLIQRSPDPYHAVEAIKEALGFTDFVLSSHKELKPGKKYFLKKGGFVLHSSSQLNRLRAFALSAPTLIAPPLSSMRAL